MTIEPSAMRFTQYMPTDGSFREYFTGSGEQLERRMFDAIAMVGGMRDAEDRFDIVNTSPINFSPPASLYFLEFLVGLLRPKRILEIGTLVGASALFMAATLPAGGEIVTLEVHPDAVACAERNFKANGKDTVIRCIPGNAWDSLARLESEGKPFDFVFLDANKERYWEYFERLAPMLAPGGLFMVDDVFMQGDIFNEPPTTEKGEGVVRLLHNVSRLGPEWGRILLPLIDGYLLLYKKS